VSAQPTVSVLIPSYNHGRFLRACLDRIVAQTLTDWEVVLVDDGSTDDSVKIAREYGDARVRVYVNEQNLGTYGTEKRALELSTGRYVAILNSDDLWAPTKLERQVDALEATPSLPLAYTLGRMVDETERIDTVEDVHADWPREPIQEILPRLLYENRVLASSVLFRRETARFDPSLRYSGDWVALLGPANASPVACVPDDLTFWRQHTHNTYRRSEKQVREEIRVRRAILARSDGWRTPRIRDTQILEGLGRCAMNLAALEVLRGRTAEARSAALKAVRLMPDRRLALRRLAATLLPPVKARRRLWPKDETTFENPREDLPPLHL